LQDVQSSIALVSESFRIRVIKNHALLHLIVTRLDDQIHSGDIQLYLAQLENAIFEIQEMTYRLAKKIEGNFKDHPLLEAPLNSREDYGHFLELCKDQYVVNIDNFLMSHVEELRRLQEYLNPNNFRGKDRDRARNVSELIGLALSDPKKCNMKRSNLRYGDIIIALDTPLHNVITSKDTLFKMLTDGLGRPHKIITFK
jgi:hypothetical protein